MKKIKVIIKNPEEEYGRVCWISNDLETLQTIIGGYIEIAPCGLDGTVIIMDEEGSIKGLKPNFENGPGLTIKGTVIVCGSYGEELVDCPWDFDRWKRFIDMRRPMFDH